MKLDDVMRDLEAHGTAQNRKIYARHGAPENQFGVSFGHLGKVRKKLGTDHELALELFATGNSDAQILATMVVDPARLTMRDLDQWVAASKYPGLIDYISGVAARSRSGRKLAEKWVTSPREHRARAGWVTLGRLAHLDVDLPDAYFTEHLETLEATIDDVKNRTREGMNHALICMGGRSKGLRRSVLAAAKRIGTVHVDHGETGCKTPSAPAYITKMWKHAESKGFDSPAAQERARNRRGGCAR